jgi:hypothetical protein
MKHVIICLGIIAGFFGIGHAIQTPDEIKKSDQTMMKMRQIDLLTQIIPLALTKEQINKLLPAVERARAKVKMVQKAEAERLAKLDAKISAAIKDAEEKQIAPPKALLDELASATIDMSMKRQVAIDENTDAVVAVFKETCNAGQQKAAGHSLAPQLLDPTLDPKKMTEDDKIRFFVREILLDPQAYDVLVALEKTAPKGG